MLRLNADFVLRLVDESLDQKFGLIIAYLLPGLVGLAGASHFSPTLAAWLTAVPCTEPTISGFLYAIVGSLTIGMVVSAVRWAVIDSLHHRTGLPRPEFDFSKLVTNLDAFRVAVEHYYRHYQFYANMSVSVLFYAICHAQAVGDWSRLNWLALVVLEVILLTTSRDTLRRYYQRGAQILKSESLIR